MSEAPGRYSILYVDDDPDIREIVDVALGLESRLDVTMCDSGVRAIELCETRHFDLVLLDVMMPHVDGPATLLRLGERLAAVELRVAFVTAKAAPAEIERFFALGAVGVIAKPFDPMLLAGRVLQLLEGAERE